MMAFLETSLMVTDVISILITFPGYMFILAVNILDWMEKKRCEISDQLIFGISLSILTHRVFEIGLDLVIVTKRPQTIQNQALLFLSYLSIVLCTFIFSTWLAIHFCLKIVNINCKPYICIQRMFPKIFPWILLPSILASLLISAPPAHWLGQNHLINSTVTPQYREYSFLQCFFYFLPYNVFLILCFLLFFSSGLNIILSLQRHIRRMHSSSSEFTAQIVATHITAIITIFSLLAFNLFYFVFLVMFMAFNLSQQATEFFPFLYALCHVFGVAILIKSSRKLQKKLHFVLFYC
ncbi:hypothetical protein GDO81_025252, partial [Engystomops pustulosus]